MTLQEFVDKYDGEFVEVAGSSNAKNQCVDLVNAYLRDVLDHPIVEHTNARDFPNRLKDFEWIKNTPKGVPKPGDIMIWQHNKYGHTSIFLDGDEDYFHSFDQNYPSKTPAHKVLHTYIKPKVAGWLRPKIQNTPITMPENTPLEACMSDREKFWKERDDERKENKKLSEQINDLLKEKATNKDPIKVAEYREEIKGLKREHELDLDSVKQKYQQDLKNELARKDAVIGSLKDQVLLNSNDWKKRFTSRKFLLVAPASVFNMIVALIILMGFKPDPVALATALTSLNAVVALFVVPEAISDHQERMGTLP